MKLSTILLKPYATLEFSREEFRVLRESSEAHYDWKCRSLSAPGGIIYGMGNGFDNDKDTASWQCSSQDVDLLAKTVETTPFPRQSEDMSTSVRLFLGLSKVFRRLQDEYDELTVDQVVSS